MKSKVKKFNKDVFIAAAEALDTGNSNFAFSCNAIAFVNNAWFRALGLKEVSGLESNLFDYEVVYGRLMAEQGLHQICCYSVSEINHWDLNKMREHRVFMLLLAAEVLGNQSVEKWLKMDWVRMEKA